MTVQDILIEALKRRGANGLYNAAGECGCTLDCICPCGEQFMDCEAARMEILTEERDGFVPGDQWYTILADAEDAVVAPSGGLGVTISLHTDEARLLLRVLEVVWKHQDDYLDPPTQNSLLHIGNARLTLSGSDESCLLAALDAVRAALPCSELADGQAGEGE